jgi:small subunit ribosomal protein S21
MGEVGVTLCLYPDHRQQTQGYDNRNDAFHHVHQLYNGKKCSLFLLLMKFYLILRRLFPEKKSELNKNKELKMIIVPVKEGENIERALKKFKRKYEKTGVVKELRRRQQFDKPSELKRLKMEHAIYVQKLQQNED